MSQVNFTVTFDTYLPNEESHIHRITRFYKRAVLNEADKTWTHHFYIGKHIVHFTLTPKKHFFERAELIEASESRYEMLRDAAMRVRGVSVNRLQEMINDLRSANKKADWLQIVDILDDLEDLIFENDQEKSDFERADSNGFINSLSFLALKICSRDPAIQNALTRLNQCARFYFSTNIIIQKARFKRALDKALKEANNPRCCKEKILEKVDLVSSFITESLERKNLTRSIKMIHHFDRSINLTQHQENTLLSHVLHEELDEDFALSIYKQADEYSGSAALADRKDFRVRFNKRHFDDILTKIEKLIDFANVPLTNELVDRLEKASQLLLEENPDGDSLDFLLTRIFNEVMAKCGDRILAEFGRYLEYPQRDERKIFTINNLIEKNNFLSAFSRIVDLTKK